MDNPEEIGNCIGCNEPLRVGQVVTAYDDEVGHYNCHDPYSLKRQPELDNDPEVPPPAILLGSPALYVPLDRLTHSPASDVRTTLQAVKVMIDEMVAGEYNCSPHQYFMAAQCRAEGLKPTIDAALAPTTLASADYSDEISEQQMGAIRTLAGGKNNALASADDGLCERTLEEAAKVADAILKNRGWSSVADAIRNLKPKPEGEELANNA